MDKFKEKSCQLPKAKAKHLVFLIVLLGLSSLAFAQATGTWALTSNANYSVSGNVSGTNMVKGAGTGAATYGANGVYSNSWNSASQTAAVTANDYYQYTLTATSAITINSVSVSTMKSGGNGGTAAVYYSVNGATETLIGGNITIPTAIAATTVTGLNIAVPNGQTFRVRVYAWSLSNASRAFYNRDLTIISSATSLASANPAVDAANILQGSLKSPIYKFTLNANAALNFTGLSFTTTGTYVAGDLVNFKLWTFTADTFASSTQVGTTLTTGLGTGAHSFAAFTQALTASATRYFWITADYSNAATGANTLAVSALPTGNITVSSGITTGTAYAGGTQTILGSNIALSSTNLAVAAANIGQGSTNNIFYKFTTAVTGEATTLNSVAFTTAGTAVLTTDLTNFKLWYSTTDSYVGAAQIGATMTTLLSAGTHTFTGLTQAISGGTTGYFWITADLAAAATVNRTLYVSPAITAGNLTFAIGTKSGTAYAGGAQTIIAVVTTLASANPAVDAANLNKGSLKNPIYRFTLNPTLGVTMTALSFTTAGTYQAPDVTKYQLWTSTADLLSGATQLGTDITATLGTGAHTFASLTQALAASTTRYFWITTDLAAGGTSGQTMTVSALTGTNITVSLGSKAGTAYASGTQTLLGATTLASADPAIPATDVVQGSLKVPIYKFTLNPNAALNFTGLSFATTGTYVAADLVNFKLWTFTADTFASSTQVGTTLTTGLGTGAHSFAAFTQALTASATRYFWITADYSNAATGANTLAVSALPTGNITVSSGITTGTAYAGGTQTILASYIALSSANLAVAAANIGQGRTNNVFYAFSTAVTGAATTLNSVAFTTAGTAVVTTDLTNFKLWYSTSNSYVGAAQIGATMTTLLSAGTHTFTGLTQAIGSGVTGYFWITADLAAAATVNRTLSVNPAITTGNLTFALGTKSGTAYAGGIQTIIAVVTTLASANPAVAASNIGFGTLKNPIYRFTLNPTVNVNMTGLNFVANGSYVAADITNFRIWSSTTDDLTTASQLGTTLTTIAASGAQQNFAAFSQALSGGVMRYFWITTDIAPGAVATHTLTVAALTTARVTVSSGTKAGTAYIGGTQTVVSGTVTLSSTNPALPAGYLPQGAPKKPVYRFILTRDPAIVNINFTGLTFTTSGTYTATDISKFQLWYSTADNLSSAAWVGTDLITGLGTGSHSFAAFTIPVVESTAHYFWITTDLSATAVLGKTLTVAAVTTANLTLSAGNKTGSTSAGAAQTVTAPVTTIDSVEPAIEASMLAPSNAKRPLERFTLTTDGLVNVTSVNFTSSGDYSASDITKFQLWTGIIDDLTGAALIGGDITTSLGAGTHAFSSFSLALSSEEPQYFWITIDASASATAGKKISIDALGTSNFSVSAGSKTGSATQGGEQTFSAAQPWLYAIGQPVGPLVGAGTGYQLRVTVHYGSGTNAGEHAYLDQRCRSDFGDIRFFEGATELSYWIESMVRYDRAIIWVKISGDMSTNAIPFSIRFGNQSVTTTSNGGNTFLFFDDFNRTDNSFAKWTKHKMLDGSTITIPTGKNYARLAGGIPTGTYGHSVLGSAATYNGLTDGSVEYRLRVGQDAISEVGVRGTFANPGTGYKGRIDGRINYQGGSSILAPPYYTWTWLTDAPELFDSPVPGAWYHGTVNAFGTKINLLKDDVLKRSSNLATITGPGEISLQNHYGPYSDYDWVAVRKYVGGLEPAHGAWIWAPVALAASAVCHNGFTAHWEAVPGATGYQLDVLEDDGTTIITGWNSVPVSLDVHRVEIIDINHAYKYRIRALFNSDVSPNSNIISVSTTAVFDGVTASTTILGAPDRTYVPPITDNPPFTNNDITIDPVTTETHDYFLVVTWHPTGFDTKPNARLVLTVTCSDNSALSGVYNINHAGMGFTPIAGAYKWGGVWYDLSPITNADSTIVSIPSLAKGGRGQLIIALDNGSGSLPVELTAFQASINAYNKVVIQWVTQSETEALGYGLYRGVTEFLDEAISLDTFIAATNTSQTQIYQYVDNDLTEAGVYYYWLENRDMDGSNTIHGPITVTLSYSSPGTPSIPVVPGVNSCFPNPFNPTTTIQYGVEVKGEVELLIYNLKGQLVRNLLREPKNQGTYEVVWNGKDNNSRQVSSGVYLLKMKLGKSRWNYKLVLSK